MGFCCCYCYWCDHIYKMQMTARQNKTICETMSPFHWKFECMREQMSNQETYLSYHHVYFEQNMVVWSHIEIVFVILTSLLIFIWNDCISIERIEHLAMVVNAQLLKLLNTRILCTKTIQNFVLGYLFMRSIVEYN